MHTDVHSTTWMQPPTDEKGGEKSSEVLDTNLHSYMVYYLDGSSRGLDNCPHSPQALRKAIREGGGYLIGENVLINAATVMRWHLTETYAQSK